MRNLRLVHSNTWFEQSNTGSLTADEAAGRQEHQPRLGPRRGEFERDLPPLDPAVQAMLEHVRIIVPLPPAVRARVLARARGHGGASMMGK